VVNVHIHQFKPGGAVVDAAALAQFQEQWATYRKLITSNSLSHREVGGILRDTLNAVFASPFTFLDIACGNQGPLLDIEIAYLLATYRHLPISSSNSRFGLKSAIGPMRVLTPETAARTDQYAF
jgi:hypothetical protein